MFKSFFPSLCFLVSIGFQFISAMNQSDVGSKRKINNISQTTIPSGSSQKKKRVRLNSLNTTFQSKSAQEKSKQDSANLEIQKFCEKNNINEQQLGEFLKENKPMDVSSDGKLSDAEVNSNSSSNSNKTITVEPVQVTPNNNQVIDVSANSNKSSNSNLNQTSDLNQSVPSTIDRLSNDSTLRAVTLNSNANFRINNNNSNSNSSADTLKKLKEENELEKKKIENQKLILEQKELKRKLAEDYRENILPFRKTLRILVPLAEGVVVVVVSFYLLKKIPHYWSFYSSEHGSLDPILEQLPTVGLVSGANTLVFVDCGQTALRGSKDNIASKLVIPTSEFVLYDAPRFVLSNSCKVSKFICWTAPKVVVLKSINCCNKSLKPKIAAAVQACFSLVSSIFSSLSDLFITARTQAAVIMVSAEDDASGDNNNQSKDDNTQIKEYTYFLNQFDRELATDSNTDSNTDSKDEEEEQVDGGIGSDKKDEDE